MSTTRGAGASAAGARPPAAAAEGYRRELGVHCYRMLGSIAASERVAGEAIASAVKKAGRRPLRTWLYRTATLACLDELAEVPRRVVPADVVRAGNPSHPPPRPSDLPWLEPYPDQLLDAAVRPDAPPTTRETIELAYLTGIHFVAPMQRAVLLLRDVVGWRSRATAEALDVTLQSANSALQRGRLNLGRRQAQQRSLSPAGLGVVDEQILLRRYLAALETGDPAARTRLLARDVRVSYPPRAWWLSGRDAFVEHTEEYAVRGDYRYLPSAANRQPAVAIYVRRPTSRSFRPLALEVLRFSDGLVVEAVDFAMPALFRAFGLPASL